eukprot:TRINITY_DN9353_c0_g1_i7.p1 TRINITY_DN9353_c0_g1~~TRINITY_DN9353_c0_g1_i7.p1  ORF type:complete len:131 (-),score=16.89 TRINITY_DN9353_c0_g1_i7:514-906(-)
MPGPKLPALDLSGAKEIAAHDLKEPAGVHSAEADEESPPSSQRGDKPMPSPRREWAKSARAKQKASEHAGSSQLTCQKCGKSFGVMVHKDDAESARYRARRIGHEQGCQCYDSEKKNEDDDGACCKCVIL